MSRKVMIAVITSQAKGAWPNDSTVRKVNSQPDDGTPDGTLGVVIGSVDVSEMKLPARFAYCVHWDGALVPIMCVDMNNDGTPRLELRKAH